jgi:hypothetical protein
VSATVLPDHAPPPPLVSFWLRSPCTTPVLIVELKGATGLPRATLPTKRVTYRAFDLTPHFRSASSFPQEMRVALGMCKFGYQGSFCVGAHAANAACKAFLLSLHVA